jgi:heparanase
LDPTELDKGKSWAAYQSKVASKFASNPSIWLGETSSAACGGQPGVSDSFASGFFWLDQLGYMATYNQKLVVRQTLAGGTYALLRGPGSDPIPAPDYFSSIIWKRTMGTRVLSVVVDSIIPHLRAYAHCAPTNSPFSGSISVLLINLSKLNVSVALPQALASSPRTEFHLTSVSITSTSISLNGDLLRLNSDGSLPSLNGSPVAPSPYAQLAATSYAFVVFHSVTDYFAACNPHSRRDESQL